MQYHKSQYSTIWIIFFKSNAQILSAFPCNYHFKSPCWALQTMWQVLVEAKYSWDVTLNQTKNYDGNVQF